MSKPKQNDLQRKLAENQVVFRNINQRVPKGFEELQALAKEDNQESLVELPTGLLYFTCECSDEECRAKVKMTMKTWQRIHRKPDEFCVAIGHVIPDVEDVCEEHKTYQVVKKKVPPPQDAKELHKTSVNFHKK